MGAPVDPNQEHQQPGMMMQPAMMQPGMQQPGQMMMVPMVDANGQQVYD